MTKEGKWTIGILLIILAVLWLIPENDAPIEENSAKLTKAAEEKAATLQKEKSKKEVTIERPINGRVEIKGLSIANENIELRNPFTYQHETRGEKVVSSKQSNEKAQRPINETVAPPVAPTMPQPKNPDKWQLKGIIISDNSKQALLSLGDKNIAVGIGSYFDDNKVVDITDDELIYEGQSGRGSLKFSNP